MTNLDFSLLDEELGGTDGTESNKIPVVQLEEGQIDPRYTRTSYSSSQLLHSCPRKYQLKCLQAEKADDSNTNVTFAFGKAVGVGIQEYLVHKDWHRTLLALFLEWDVDLLAENEKQKKSIAHAVHAIQMFRAMVDDGFLSEYVVATFKGKPAAELSFRVTFPGRYAEHTYRGYLDLVLQHLFSGEFVVMEDKTSSGTWVNHYQYKNSSQAIGYSAVLDQLEGEKSSYSVKYFVFMTKLNRYEEFDFPKSYHQRALWLRDRMWDVQVVETLVEQEGNYGIWPMHGESCFSFGRTCEYMDVCHMDTENLMAELRENQLEERDAEGEIKQYDVDLTLEQML